MTHLKVELNKQTCQALTNLLDGVFRTGASITVTIDFNSLLHYPPGAALGEGDEYLASITPPTVVVQPDKMTIEIK